MKNFYLLSFLFLLVNHLWGQTPVFDWVSEPKHEKLIEIKKGLYAAIDSGKWGLKRIEENREEWVTSQIYDIDSRQRLSNLKMNKYGPYSFIFAKRKDQYFLIDEKGEEKVKLKSDYESITYYKDDLFQVSYKGGTGFINLSGEEVLPTRSDYVLIFDFEHYIIRTKRMDDRNKEIEEFEVITKKEKYTLPSSYFSLYEFPNDFKPILLLDQTSYNIPVKIKSNYGIYDKYGIYDIKSKRLVSSLYKKMHFYDSRYLSEKNYYQPIAVVKKDKLLGAYYYLVGYINHLGEEITPFIYDQGHYGEQGDSDSLYRVKKNGLYGYINQKGEEQNIPAFTQASSFYKGKAKILLNNQWWLIDRNENFALSFPHETDGIYEYDFGVNTFKQGLLYGAINDSAEVILAPNYKFISLKNAEEGLIRAGKENSVLLYTLLGEELVSQDRNYSQIGSFYGDYATIKRNDKKGIINTSGKEIIRPIYEDVKGIVNGIVLFQRNENWGIINDQGIEFYPAIFDKLEYLEDGNILAEDRGKTGILRNPSLSLLSDKNKNPISSSKPLVTWLSPETNLNASASNYTFRAIISSPDNSVKRIAYHLEGSRAENVDIVFPNVNQYLFEQKINLQNGENQLNLIIKTSEKTYSIESPVITYLPRPNVKAVIVGVDEYKYKSSGFSNLKFTIDDAYRYYAFLKSPEGGGVPDDQISLLIRSSANYDSITQEFKKISQSAAPNDLFILFYAGHGTKDALIPYDYDGTKEKKISHEMITDIFAKSEAKHKLCIVDACHSGAIRANMVEEYYKNLVNSKGGFALMLSAKEDETASERSEFGQGIFSYYLIKGLKGAADGCRFDSKNQIFYKPRRKKDKNQIITIQEIFDYVYYYTVKETNGEQHPVLKGDYNPKMAVGVVRD